VALGLPQIARLRAEYGGTGGLVGSARPTLSWAVERAESWLQRRYELQAGSDRADVESGESLFVPWPFEPLRSRERRTVRVRATSTDGRQTPWSDEIAVEAGLLHPADWHASFVALPQDRPPTADGPCPFLRQEFLVERPAATARLYVTALGVYEPHLNGSVVGDEVLAPNWTSYNNRIRYQVFDVADRLRVGRNVLGAILGDGWYRGRLGGFDGRRNTYGPQIALVAQLEIEFGDGRRQSVVSDESWRASSGPILASGLYDGERYDARLELVGWSEPNYDDAGWQAVEVVEHPLETLVAPIDPPIRRIDEIAPLDVLESPSGKLIVDFGQNLVGRLRIQVSGQAGDAITIRHAEALDGGELALEPLRSARAEDGYVLKGGGVESWEPRFTFHGFRYAQIDGWPGTFDPVSVAAVVIHTDFERTGWFECSNPLVNRLHENAVWSMRGNFLGLPTDCPQRDERLGWTGDIQVFAPTASLLHDVDGVLASWLCDVAAEQAPDGRVPHCVPDIFPAAPTPDVPEWVADLVTSPAAAWGDAAVIVPWVLYERFGDARILATQWHSMRNWVDYVEQLTGPSRIWDNPSQFGDWLDPLAPLDRPHRGQTPPALVATAYFARSAELVARAAEVLGLQEDAARYRSLSDEVRSAFHAAFFDEGGNVAVPSATAQALALQFALAQTDDERRRASERLSQIVAAFGYRISTGFVGTPIVCDALSEAGDLESAYRLLLQTECPSWLYPVTMGATTIWERWDALLPDGNLNIPVMTSLNHYALGAVVDWLYRVVGGLEPAEPGYRRIRFRPRPGGALTHASARHITPYGEAAISWRVLDDLRLEVAVVVPPNTCADVVLPGSSEPFEIRSGSHSWSVAL
jgi:alpha-L-rhamnosidase